MWQWFLDSVIAQHLTLLATFFLITWLPSIRGGFVSDDIEGVRKFSDYFDPNTDTLVNYYETEVGGKTVRFGNREFNPHIGYPACIIRWLRLNIGAKFQVIAKNKKGHEVHGYIQSAVKHHAISLAVHLVNIVLAYFFLANVFGFKLALLTVLLFIAHPLGCQSIAWISGIGYLLSLFGIFASLLAAIHFTDIKLLVPVVTATTLLSVSGMMAGVGTWILLLFLGYAKAAYAALAISAISLYKQGRSIVTYRKNEFKKQQMGRSTFLNWRKPIVMVKTLYYYVKLIAFPKRLGLFHSWGYHYEETIEHVDGNFWKGLICVAGLVCGLTLAPLPVQLGLLWFIAFIFIFLNFITAQQFVADRYGFIPSFGFCLIAAYVLQAHPVLYGLLLGIYVMRCWAHIPTFEDEVKFYQSNIWNFPNSEVAYGNLGVVYVNRGFPGAAADTWFMSHAINPFYDVPLYNLFSMFKGGGQLEQARDFLQKCLNAKIVHFPDAWTKEFADLEVQINRKKEIDELNMKMNQAFQAGNFEEMAQLRKALQDKSNPPSPPPAQPPTTPP